MTLKPHPYHGIEDFIVMTCILTVGRKTSKQPYYIHPGDLGWWMFYNDHDDSHWHEYVHIWDLNHRPCGWSLIDPDWYSFDFFLMPEMHGSTEEAYILDWSIQKLTEIVQAGGGKKIRTMWISENDEDRIEQLEKRGFVQSPYAMGYMEHPLNTHIPEMVVPPDFTVHSLQGESDLQRRAAASFNAFRSNKDFDEYWPRYQRFMRSPVYHPDFDLVMESADGRFASFCIIWPDPVNQIGLFEPVGTHSEFRRRGLGRAVITEGLNRLKAYGMRRAMVCVDDKNPGALQLYRAVGFEIKHQLLTYEKSI